MSAPGSDHDHGGDGCSFVCPAEVAASMAEAVRAEVDDVTLAFAFDARGGAPRAGRVPCAWRERRSLRDGRIAMFDSEAPYPLIAEMTRRRHQGDRGHPVVVPGTTRSFIVARDDALIVISYPTDEHDGAEPVLPDEVATIVAALPEP